MKLFQRTAALGLAVVMSASCLMVNTATVMAAPSVSAGWNETLYAEWYDSNPDSEAVQVGYKLASDANYTYLAGNDLKYLVRPAKTAGYGRVDIPGLKAGRYDLIIKASDGTEHTRKGIQVYEYDRSGYAHFKNTTGVGAYNDDGTLKDNAIVVYVTEENKDTVEVPGYEGHAPVPYASSTTGATWTRETAGVGNILNNNHKYIREITGDNNHPLVFRFIGEVTPPKNLTPYNTKTLELGGSKGDNGNLAITKYAKNVTIEGIGDDATINGWGFTFSQTSTCPKDAGENLEVRNLTFKNYPEDALGFQGDDPVTCPIKRVWVHNNVFYPGYCANPAESDKADGDGSCDFKRGQYYTMSYNHYVKCHKTNLLGAGDSNDQFFMSLHHNWYEQVESRQPLAAGGNVHVYNTFFDHAGSTTIDLRGKGLCFSENNYFDTCKNPYKTRKSTSHIKTFGDLLPGSDTKWDIKGGLVQATTRDQKGLPNAATFELTFPDGKSMVDWDTNPDYFYYDAAAKKTNVAVLNDTADVPEYVKTYAGTLKQFPVTESGEIIITVKDEKGALVKDAAVTANGINFRNNNDGTYTATKVALGSEYIIKVSKEGYSNQLITSKVLENDGETFEANAALAVDYDGFAAVLLTAGKDKTPVTDATVTLADGTVLAHKGEGLYQSEKQIKVGDYKATVKLSENYVALTGEQTVVVKTTDAPTEINVTKAMGTVAVSLVKASGEEGALNLSKAKVAVGEVQLTNDGTGKFTGQVEVATPYDIFVSVPGWTVKTISPETITASVKNTAEATVTLASMGKLFTWNYTTGENTEDFFTLTNIAEKSGPVQMEYNGEALTKAIKVNSSLRVTFDATDAGTLYVVLAKTKATSTLLLDNTADEAGEATISVKDGVNAIEIPSAGTYTLRKGKDETHMYLVQFAAKEQGEDPTESTTESSTESTSESTTETTTQSYDVPTDEVTWNVSSDLSGTVNGLTFGEAFLANSEEAGPREFKDGDKTYGLADYVQGKANPANAEGVGPQSALTTDRIPVKGSFMKFVPEKDGTFTVAAKTNGGKVTYITDGSGNTITTIGSLESDTSYDVIHTPVKAGETYYMYSAGSKICVYYIGFTAGEVIPPTPPTPPTPAKASGDVDNSGAVTSNDAALVLYHILSKTEDTIKATADMDGDGKVDAADAANILVKVVTGNIL